MEQESEILQRLVRIETKLEGFMQYVNEDVTEKSSDHEKRIRFLERYALLLLGGFGLLMIAIQLFIKK